MVLLLIAGVLAAAAVFLWYLPRNKRPLVKLTARIPAGVLICASFLTLLAFLFPLPFRGAICNQYEFPPISSSGGKQFAQVKVHLLWLGVGIAEPERMRAGLQRLHASLDEAKIQHVFYESPGTDHEWQTWRRDLKDFAPRLF